MLEGWRRYCCFFWGWASSYIRGVEISVKATRRGDETPSLFLRFSCFSFCNKKRASIFLAVRCCALIWRMRAKDETNAGNILLQTGASSVWTKGEPEALDVRLSHGHTQPLRLIFSLLCASLSFRQLRKKKSPLNPTFHRSERGTSWWFVVHFSLM